MKSSNKNITIYFEDLIKYALNLISDNCDNVYVSDSSEAILPAENEFKDDVEFTYVTGGKNDTEQYKRSHNINLIPGIQSFRKVYRGSLDIDNPEPSSVAFQLKDFLISKGVYSKAGAIMTSKSILNFFSVLSIFLCAKVVFLNTLGDSNQNKNNDEPSNDDQNNINENKKYVLYSFDSEIRSTFMLNDDYNIISREEEETYIDNLLTCISDKNNINPNQLIVKYVSSSSSSSSSCSCSCSCSCSSSSSSCSSSSSSYIVYMMIK